MDNYVIDSQRSKNTTVQFQKKTIQPYNFRSWPIFSSYGYLLREFGIDVALYQMFVEALIIIFAIVYVVYGVMTLMFWLTDHAKPDFIFIYNFTPSFIKYPILPLRGAIWLCACMIFMVFICFLTTSRKISEQQGQQLDAKVEDFTIIVQNIAAKTSQGEFSDYLFQTTGKRPIKFMKVTQPSTFVVRQKILYIEREYYDRIAEDTNGLIHPRKTRLFRFCRFFRLLSLAQVLGAFRNQTYYWKRIAVLNARLKKVEKQKHNVDVYLATFNYLEDRDVVLKKLNKICVKRLNKYKPNAFPAPHPKEIIYQNLDSTFMDRLFRSVIGYVLMFVIILLLFCILCPLREFTRSQRYASNNYFMQQFLYWSSFLMVFVFDQGLRPVLRWAVVFEKHHSWSSQENNFLIKYFIYVLIFRFTVIFSRTSPILLSSDYSSYDWDVRLRMFIHIFDYSRDQRQLADSVANDLQTIMWLEVFCYNLFDISVSYFMKLMMWLKANTDFGICEMKKGRPIRYASLYTNLSVLIFVTLCFGHVSSNMILIFLLYLLIHCWVTRYRLLRLTSPPARQNKLFRTSEIIWYFCVLGGFAGITSSYYDDYSSWLALLGGAFLLSLAFGFFGHRLIFWFLQRRCCDSSTILTQTLQNIAKKAQPQCFQDSGEWYELYENGLDGLYKRKMDKMIRVAQEGFDVSSFSRELRSKQFSVNESSTVSYLSKVEDDKEPSELNDE